MTVPELQRSLAGVGLNLSGALRRSVYDQLVPRAWKCSRIAPDSRTVLIVGNGGPEFWSKLERAPEADREHKVDRYTERVLREVTSRLTPGPAIALYNEQREGAFLPLCELAERAGLGSRGRIGLLIHPEYGPWVSLRALVYLDLRTTYIPREQFDPCANCEAPCELACPGRAVQATGIDLDRCLRTKRTRSECQAGCDARVACVIGREHRFIREEVEYHSRAALLGFGTTYAASGSICSPEADEPR